MKYIPRWLETRIAAVLESHPVIVLTGPRQVGKSTLLEYSKFSKDWHYITLDDPDALDQAKEDPKGLLWEDVPTIIDEAQRCPELLLTVKYLVDKSRGDRKFILSGSGNISLRQAPRETLAGRAKYLHLTGFAYRELKGLSASDGILDRVCTGRKIEFMDIKSSFALEPTVWRGCLPAVVLAKNDNIVIERLSGYIDTYIQRDIQNLVKVRHPENFRRLMEALSQATGWESVQDELSKICGETRANVSRYMSLLKDTNLLCELKGYINKTERAYRQSKYYWFDTGSACFLAGIHSAAELKKPRVRGRYFENFVFQQILSWASLQLMPPEVFYWKPKTQQIEVDFVISTAGKAIGIEVKSSEQITFGDTKQMRGFLKSHPNILKGIIVYAGSKVYPVASNIYAVPWTMI
ncbi:MAG: ATP-binding protein [Candidatus Omnitrophica bacterium]|nr:ATP-binding protein [Candidatus Omnitrophota bacterium]